MNKLRQRAFLKRVAKIPGARLVTIPFTNDDVPKFLKRLDAFERRSRKSTLMVGSALSLLLIFSVTTIHAATNIADSTDLADVEAAHALCNDLDTLVIPAGTSTWASVWTVTKCLNIYGAGTNSTRIIRTSGDIVSLETTANLPIRISGITFDLDSFSGDQRSAIIFAGVTNNTFRIDHCRFYYGSRTINTLQWQFGLIDHCTVYDSDSFLDAQMLVDGDTMKGDTSFAAGLSLGTTNSVYIESCTFVYGTAVTSGPNELLYGNGGGGRAVFRYNTILATNMNRDFLAVDAHGQYPPPTFTDHGTFCYEVYNNTYIYHHTYRLMNLRGGTHLVYSNMATTIGAAGGIELKDEGESTYMTPSVGGWITNTFIFSNTNNATEYNEPYVEAGSEPYVIEDVNYFTRAPESGDFIFPYTPLVYPHPLVTAQDGGVPINITATTLRGSTLVMVR